jgi:hypothetical protein
MLRLDLTDRDVLGGEEKILREAPLGIGPLAGAAIPGSLAHLDHFIQVVLVRAFGPDRLSFAKVKSKTRLPNRYSLPLSRP